MSLFGQPQQQPQQQLGAQQSGIFSAAPATPGPLSVNDLSRQPQQQQQQLQAGFSLFGQQSQQTQAQQPPAQASGFGAQPSGSLFGSRASVGPTHPGLSHSASSGSLYGNVGTASQGAAQQGSVYVPGYLSKIRSNKPYASHRRVSGHHSPTNEEDGNTSRDVDGRGGPTSPTHAFQSSFFSSRSPTMDDRVTTRSESIFGPGGLRGNRRSVGPGGSVAGGGAGSWGDDASLRGSVGPGGLRRSASGAFGSGGREPSVMAMDDDEDMPPVQGLREGTIAGDNVGGFGAASITQGGAGLENSLYASRLGISTASRASTAGVLGASTGLGASSAVNGIASTANGSADPTRTLLIFGFPVALKNAVLRFFETIGEIVAMTPVSSLSDASASGNGAANGGAEASQLGSARYDALQITFAEQWCALRALRRNGEVVPGAGCRVGIRFSNENLHREVVQNGINSAVLTSANAAVLANGGDIGDMPGRSINAAPGPNVPVNALTETANGNNNNNNALTAQSRQNRESTPAFGRPISMVDTPSLVLRTPGSGGSGSSSANASPFTKAAANIFGGSRSGTTSSAHPSPAHRHGRHSSAVPPSSLFRSALTNSPAPAQNAGGTGAGQANAVVQKADGNQATPGGGLGQRISDAIFGW
ncbi:hypothetical protein OC846_002228 [Tilletia horrida]|uniref:RRM Nup35-type domain-containing protein n=1 Tax=Tilletia horrida TaxID=155126 RepID=A0AAN6GSF1_9BASI|nr:hypothetical protein OC846_002228 [Tilletia horrida]KAK0568981.1 hypothetical protein OC861_001418 [Tilletia horrida]